MKKRRKLQEFLIQQITGERNQEMAEFAAKRKEEEKRCQRHLRSALKEIKAAGIDVARLDAFDRKLSREADAETEATEARMAEESRSLVVADEDAAELHELRGKGARTLRPAWTADFSSADDSDRFAGSISAKEVSGHSAKAALLTGGTCKNYYNWAKGAGSGLFGSGVGKNQSWVEFGFWYRPRVTRFYSVIPQFRFRGFYVVRADDGFFTSKRARVAVSAWTNVYQYNWKGWNHVNVLNRSGSNINESKRLDVDRHTYNSYLLGGGDWAYIRCTIGLYVYARGSGSRARNDFATGNANYLCVPHCHVY